MVTRSHYTVGCDTHEHNPFFAILGERGNFVDQGRFNHEPGLTQEFLSQFQKNKPVAPTPILSVGRARPGKNLQIACAIQIRLLANGRI